MGRGRETAVYIPLAALSSMAHALSLPFERLILAGLFLAAGLAGAAVDWLEFEEPERAVIWAAVGLVLAGGFVFAYLRGRRWTLTFASPTATITVPAVGASSQELADFMAKVRDQLARRAGHAEPAVSSPPAPGAPLSAQRL
jgi:hypothetical protein